MDLGRHHRFHTQRTRGGLGSILETCFRYAGKAEQVRYTSGVEHEQACSSSHTCLAAWWGSHMQVDSGTASEHIPDDVSAAAYMPAEVEPPSCLLEDTGPGLQAAWLDRDEVVGVAQCHDLQYACVVPCFGMPLADTAGVLEEDVPPLEQARGRHC